MVELSMSEFDNALAVLRNELRAYDQWAKSVPAKEARPAFESWYPDWPRLTTAYCDFLDSRRPEQWDNEGIGLLLLAGARDNEALVLKHELEQRPNI